MCTLLESINQLPKYKVTNIKASSSCRMHHKKVTKPNMSKISQLPRVWTFVSDVTSDRFTSVMLVVKSSINQQQSKFDCKIICVYLVYLWTVYQPQTDWSLYYISCELTIASSSKQGKGSLCFSSGKFSLFGTHLRRPSSLSLSTLLSVTLHSIRKEHFPSNSSQHLPLQLRGVKTNSGSQPQSGW